MALIFNCRQCDQPFSVPEALCGGRRACPNCGNLMPLDPSLAVGQIDETEPGGEISDETSDGMPGDVPAWATGEMPKQLLALANPPALLSYYLGLFSFIPCIGVPMAFWAITLGFRGLRAYFAQPKIRGAGYALAGISLGTLVLLAYVALIALAIRGVFR